MASLFLLEDEFGMISLSFVQPNLRVPVASNNNVFLLHLMPLITALIAHEIEVVTLARMVYGT